MEINTDTMRAANDSLSSGAEAHALQGSLYAIPPFIWLCFLKESKLEPLTSAAQVKERGRRKREREGGGKKKEFHFMYQWFRTSFRANHTPIFLQAISDSNSLACH